MTREQVEASLRERLDRLKAMDPDFDLHVELGGLLLKHVDDFTPEEKKRHDELLEILSAREKARNN